MSKQYDAYWTTKYKKVGSYAQISSKDVCKPTICSYVKQCIAVVKNVCGMMVSVCTAIRTIHTTFR